MMPSSPLPTCVQQANQGCSPLLCVSLRVSLCFRYHDESSYSVTPNHFDPDPTRWDRRTLAFNAKGGVLPPPYPSSIPLLRMRYKIDFM